MTLGFGPLVLCYHAVSDTWEHALSVTPRALERQLRAMLLRRFRPASAERVVDERGRFLHVTFDDAFASVTRALPVLERLGVPATVFACTAYADDGRPLAVAELAADAARQPEELATLTWDGLRALAERGIGIGSHTSSHAHLRALSDAELSSELAGSRERLEAELGRPCSLLAYPYGEEDERVRGAARTAGFTAAFGLPGRVLPPDRYSLPRVGIYRRDSLWRATLKTTAARHAVYLGRRVARRR